MTTEVFEELHGVCNKAAGRWHGENLLILPLGRIFSTFLLLAQKLKR
jgi:hypothetical protein